MLFQIIKFTVAWCHRCGRFPPEVRTAIPVDGRFEHIVLSCNATSDHGIIWIEREAEKALQVRKYLPFDFVIQTRNIKTLSIYTKKKELGIEKTCYNVIYGSKFC